MGWFPAVNVKRKIAWKWGFGPGVEKCSLHLWKLYDRIAAYPEEIPEPNCVMIDANLFLQKSCSRTIRILFAATLAALLLGPLTNVKAAVVTWTGGAVSGNWGVGANWDSGAAPANNDSLVFNAAVGAGQITNNLNGRTFAQISFIGVGSSFTVYGNPITLTGGISQSSSGGANTFHPDITLATNNQTFSVSGSGIGSGLQITGDIDLNGRNLTVNVTDAGTELNLNCAISGTGNITRGTGAGGLRFSGAAENTYVGTTTINGGYIFAAKANGVISIPGDVVIGNGSGVDRLITGSDNQLSTTSDVTLRDGGIFDNNDETNTVGTVTFDDGGTIDMTTGRIQIGGTVSVIGSGVSNSIINGNLHLGSFTRTFNIANTPQASDLIINAVISGGNNFGIPAGIIKSGAGVMRLNAANTYGGPTTVNEGQLTANNDLALGGTFALFGSAATIVNSNAVLMLNDAHVTNEVLTLNSTNPAGALQNTATADWVGDIILNTDVVIEASSLFGINGRISGSGGFTKAGTSTLRLFGTNVNTYAGTTVVNAGILQLDVNANNGAIPGDLVVGDGSGTDTVRHLDGDQISNSALVTINTGGVLDLNGFGDIIGGLEMTGGTAQSGVGRIRLNGNLTVNASGTQSTISGELELFGSANRTFNIAGGAAVPDLLVSAVISGTGGIIVSNNLAGRVDFSGANTYSGLTRLNNGFLVVQHTTGLGSPAAGTVLNGGNLNIQNVTVSGEALTNIAASTFQGSAASGWTGPVVSDVMLDLQASAGPSTFNLSGVISGTGSIRKVGAGTVVFSGANGNTYTGTTTVDAGTLLLDKSALNGAIPGPLVIGDGAGGVNADVVRLAAVNQIANTVPITINSSGLYDMDGFSDAIGSLAGSGNVFLGNATMNLGFNDTSTTFSGVISGTGGINKFSGTTGTQTFSGDNTYTGTTIINGGALLVNGTQPQSAVDIGSGGLLGGHGRVGVIDNSSGGIVSPGTSPGRLTSSDVVFGAGSDFNIEINGSAAGGGYDQLMVFGTNTLGGALNVTVGGGFAPAEGEEFTIIFNDNAENVTGTFAGLANNSVITTGIHKFRINYGNDVILTYTNPPLDVLTPQLTSGNGNGSIDPNECNILNLVITNVTGVPFTDVTATLSSTTKGVVITQPESAYPDMAVGARGTNTTPFQISTLPAFECSDTVELKLTVTTASGNFANVFTLPSGFEGSPVRFNNNANLGIVDSGSVTSSIVVAAIATPIKKVTVSLHLSHTSDEDLDISLVGPDGTTINLSSDNGGTGDDYGTDCVDPSRTVFDDSAASAITSGLAPFVGTFRPEQQLSAFIGKEGLDVNGAWKLIVRDDSAGSAGTLRCWSLFISPTECAGGGGACDTCPGVFTGSISNTDSLQAGRLTRNGVASGCDDSKPCPGLEDPTPRNYDVYNFTNASGSDQCVYISLTSGGAGVTGDQAFSAAYLGSFNPADLCLNYWGDMGVSTAGTRSYSVIVPAGNAFAVTVNEIDVGSGIANYTLVVNGLECPPVLAIDNVPTDLVRVHWPTTAGGYKLEANEVLTTTNWLSITNDPIVIDGRLNITNSVDLTNRFYRLHKP
jgi:autotransporter-associated beta strand protein